jgi:hypothetical protein
LRRWFELRNVKVPGSAVPKLVLLNEAVVFKSSETVDFCKDESNLDILNREDLYLPRKQTKEQIEGPLRYFGENHFRKQSWADFSKTFKNSFP